MRDVATLQVQSTVVGETDTRTGEVKTFQKSKNFHVKSFILMLLVWASFITAMIYLLLRHFMPDFEHPIWVVFPVMYFVYIAEAILFTCDSCIKCGCASGTCGYLRNVKSHDSTESFMASLKCSAPQFRMHVECYHFQTYNRTYYYTDRDGVQRSRHTTHTRRVITHRATTCILYAAWKDCSSSLRGLGDFRVVKMNFDKDYEFHDEETYRSFMYQRLYFQRANDYDVYQSFKEEFVVPGFTDLAVCFRRGERPWGLHLCHYLLSSIAMLSHPYRLWMERMSVNTDVHIRKRVSATMATMQHLPFVRPYLKTSDIRVQSAVVYQELYGTPQPDLPVAVTQAIPHSLGNFVVPLAYDAALCPTPISVASQVHQATKEERQEAYAQLQNWPAPGGVTVQVMTTTLGPPHLWSQSRQELQEIVNNSQHATPKEKKELVASL